MYAKPTPAGYHTLTPYLHVRDSAAAIAFYEKAFGAEEVMRLTMPGGGVGHAEVKIGGSRFMLADENEQWGNKGPQTLGGASGGYAIYCDDSDALFAQAVAAGATVVMPVSDQFYGDRSGTVADPFGHKWTIGTHKEDVPPAEMQKRMDAFMASC